MSVKFLMTLSWKNSSVRHGIPEIWLENWLDKSKRNSIRDEIKRFTNRIKKIKNF